jgi:hypothetical protein
MTTKKTNYKWINKLHIYLESEEYKVLFLYPGGIGRSMQLVWIYILDLTKSTNGILASRENDILTIYDAEYIEKYIIPGLDIKIIQMALDYYLKIKWLFINKEGFLQLKGVNNG